MSKFLPLNTPKALGMFNSHLSNESYVTGCVPSLADVDIYKSFNGVRPEAKWVHISRWYSHLTKLGADPRAWPAEWRIEEKQENVENEEAEELDLFGEETEDDRNEREKRKTAGTKLSTGPAPASAVIFDIKPWDEETDMAELEAQVRKIELPTLEWKASERIPVVSTIEALRILCHFNDDMFAVEEDLKDGILALEDWVQSVDIYAWNKR
jgi:elongation factor 1-beta